MNINIHFHVGEMEVNVGTMEENVEVYTVEHNLVQQFQNIKCQI